MPDYQQGKIYKIYSDDIAIPEVYIGSTTQTLIRRFDTHRCEYGKGYIRNGTCSSSRLFHKYGGFMKFKIILMEDYPCSTLEELSAREQIIIDEYGDNCVNERASDRKNPNVCEKRRIYRNRKIECECGKFVSYCNIIRHKKSTIHLSRINSKI